MSVDQQPVSPGAKPHVIIVGAGIGGLVLALLLERAGVPYIVLEKTKSIKTLGSAVSLSGTVTYLFRQLGIFEEFDNLAMPSGEVRSHDGDCNPTYSLDFRLGAPLAGSGWHIIARPMLYDMILNKIPKEKVHLSKRVVSIHNGENEARVECEDGSTFTGDIIVGADGAYSPVRQGLFKWLKERNRLPSIDDLPLPYNCMCIVGQTGVLDPEQFPKINEKSCVFDVMTNTDQPFTWAIFTVKQKRICWMVVEHLNETSSKEHQNVKNADWGPDAAGAMAQKVRDFPIPNGGKKGSTLGDLFDRTDKDLISKVVLEEKVYKTWYGGRTVLLGDSCHKMNPAGGSGAMSAVHDAVCLANWLNVVPTKAVPDLEAAFEEYRSERYPQALAAFQTSAALAKGLEKNVTGAIMRFINRNMPKWMWMMVLKRLVAYRPQASFLDPVPDKGTYPAIAQPSLTKTKILMEELRKKQQQQSDAPLITIATPVVA